MCEALEDYDHECSVNIFRFADDIVVNAEEEEETGVLPQGKKWRFDQTRSKRKQTTLLASKERSR